MGIIELANLEKETGRLAWMVGSSFVVDKDFDDAVWHRCNT